MPYLISVTIAIYAALAFLGGAAFLQECTRRGHYKRG
jgi:hypothetical protein